MNLKEKREIQWPTVQNNGPLSLVRQAKPSSNGLPLVVCFPRLPFSFASPALSFLITRWQGQTEHSLSPGYSLALFLPAAPLLTFLPPSPWDISPHVQRKITWRFWLEHLEVLRNPKHWAWQRLPGRTENLLWGQAVARQDGRSLIRSSRL